MSCIFFISIKPIWSILKSINVMIQNILEICFLKVYRWNEIVSFRKRCCVWTHYIPIGSIWKYRRNQMTNGVEVVRIIDRFEKATRTPPLVHWLSQLALPRTSVRASGFRAACYHRRGPEYRSDGDYVVRGTRSNRQYRWRNTWVAATHWIIIYYAYQRYNT